MIVSSAGIGVTGIVACEKIRGTIRIVIARQITNEEIKIPDGIGLTCLVPQKGIVIAGGVAGAGEIANKNISAIERTVDQTCAFSYEQIVRTGGITSA